MEFSGTAYVVFGLSFDLNNDDDETSEDLENLLNSMYPDDPITIEDLKTERVCIDCPGDNGYYIILQDFNVSKMWICAFVHTHEFEFSH